jgi:mevalonate kinase
VNLISGTTLVCATNEGLYAKVSAITGVVSTTTMDGKSSTPFIPKFRYERSSNAGFADTSEKTKPKWAEWDMDVSTLKAVASEGGFFCYVAGTAAVLLEHESFLKMKTAESRTFGASEDTRESSVCTNPAPTSLSGICIHNYCTTLPMGKGLSSSAAVCVLVARAFDALYGLHLTQQQLMDVAYRVGKLQQCQ